MLVAAVAAGFTSCKKEASTSTTHTQTFTLGETSYDIDNAVTIENIQYDGSDIYSAIVMYKGEIVGDGGDAQGVIVVFKGDIPSGTFSLSTEENHFPKYFFGDLEVTDIVNFNMYTLMDQDEAYWATSGSITVEATGDKKYVVTTENIMVEKIKDVTVTATSSIDYEGSVLSYVLATVTEGNLNEANIVTAGDTKFKVMMIEQKVVCFITEAGDLIGFTYTGSDIPTGTSNATVLYVNAMDISDLKAAGTSVTVDKDGDVYTVDIPSVTIDGNEYTLHYVGTLPYFDFPF